tara:strand:+ start:25 stop:963 length:939 start_codon:yes stop_codon:yes gene_type:complete
MVVDVHPEFGYEIGCSIPYAYYLHCKGELEKVVTCKGMKPFYYFCSDVEEKYDIRSLDNSTNGVQNLPNNWIHHNAMSNFGKDYSELTEDEKVKANGWLDYSEWKCPPYKEVYTDSSLDLPNKYVVISNRYNLEHGEPPIGYFDINCLYKIFNYLTDNGYHVIYKRPTNTEFVRDSNEHLDMNIYSYVDGEGVVTDFDLCGYYENVHLIDDVIKSIGKSYNESQLNIFSSADGFISMGGGSSILCSCFEKPVIIYVNTSGDIRPGYFDENSYFRKLSNAPIHAVIDKKDDIVSRNYRDYSKVYKYMEEVFNG